MNNVEYTQKTIAADNSLYEIVADEHPETLEAEVARLTEELAAERDRGLRLLAEFDNYRRRTKRERDQAEQNGKREVLLALLDVMDDFERALLYVDEGSEAVAHGVRLIHQRLNDVLRSKGVTPFDSEGKPFDPTVHEAIAMIESDGDASGTVYAEDRRGYFINGELLRPARVTVLK